MTKIPPEVLMYKLDDWADGDPNTNDFNPGRLHGKPLRLIARQFSRRLLFFKQTRNWIYQAVDEKGKTIVVYKSFPKSAGVMLMGISEKSSHWHPKSVSMEQYVEYFITKPNYEWLKQNDFELVWQ